MTHMKTVKFRKIKLIFSWRGLRGECKKQLKIDLVFRPLLHVASALRLLLPSEKRLKLNKRV